MKGIKWGLAAVTALVIASGAGKAHAASQTVIDHGYLNEYGDVFLMSDGSTWVENPDQKTYRLLDYKLKELDGDYGLSEDGRILKLANTDYLRMLPSPVDVVSLSGQYALKQDGTVWTTDGQQMDGYTDIVRIASNDSRLLTLSRTGELKSRSDSGVYTIDRFASPDDVASIAINDNGTVAVSLKSGQAQYYEWDKTRYVPRVIAGDARSVYYLWGPLLVLKQDGTVAPLEPSMLHESRLGESYPGLSGVASIQEIIQSELLLVRLNDGSLAVYDTSTHELSAVSIPNPVSLDMKIQKPALTVGQETGFSIAESWSNGASRWVSKTEAHVSIDKPYLLKLQEDGTLKATGVGEALVTVTSGGLT
ncbi:hypothetical protein [Paenibacillus glufosinatiresistens]|uniref:hypothetical protein n=1 Tax=Paenibacillus glufosinatiresistens TaxID=3070657 RepID=UPI00286DC1A1|nr:hypothetical protein [Paenibacillus sp. YX.27]